LSFDREAGTMSGSWASGGAKRDPSLEPHHVAENHYAAPTDFVLHWFTDFRVGEGWLRALEIPSSAHVEVEERVRVLDAEKPHGHLRMRLEIESPSRWTRVDESFNEKEELLLRIFVTETLFPEPSGSYHRVESWVDSARVRTNFLVARAARSALARRDLRTYSQVKPLLEHDYRDSLGGPTLPTVRFDAGTEGAGHDPFHQRP
jgi:hypothetical protein